MADEDLMAVGEAVELSECLDDSKAGWTGDLITCPVCGFEYCHFEQPTIEAGNDSYEADWEGRGDLLHIPFWCENGHEFEVCLGFHKGNTYTFARRVPDNPARWDDTLEMAK